MTKQLKSRLFLYSLVAVAVVLASRFVSQAANGFQIDLDVYRVGGRALLDSLPLYGPEAPTHGLPFTYTPLAAVLFAPFAMLSQHGAQIAWALILLGALAIFVWQCVTYAASRFSKQTQLTIAAGVYTIALLTEPVIQNFHFGQVNLVLAAAIICDLRKKTWKIPSGVLIGIAAAIKLTPLIFVAYLLFSGRFKDSTRAVIAFVAATAVGALITWDSSWNYWTQLAFDASRVGGVPYVSNQSLYGTMSRLLNGPEHADVIYKPIAAVVGITGLGLAVFARRTNRPMLGDILCACTGLLLSPISWSHHWVWVIALAVWFAFSEERTATIAKWGPWTAAGTAALFIAQPIWWVPNEADRELAHHGWQIIAGNAYFIAAAVFVAAIARTVVRSRDTPHQPLSLITKPVNLDPDQSTLSRREMVESSE